MATITWCGRGGAGDYQIQSASGIGFFATGGWNYPLSLSGINDTCFICDSGGITQGASLMNNKWTHLNSGDFNSGSLKLRCVPDAEATVKLSFSHTAGAYVQNAVIYPCSRTDNTVAPSLRVMLAKIVHTSVSAAVTSDYSDTVWTTSTPSATLSLDDSPGESGVNAAQGTPASSLIHDWHIAYSVQPTSGGNVFWSLYTELEWYEG